MFSCAGGAAGLTALELARRGHPDTWLVAVDRERYSFARELADEFRAIVPDVEDEQYGDSLLNAMVASGVQVALPCHSGELRHYLRVAPALSAHGIRWPRVGQQCLELVADKFALYRALGFAGLPVPPYSGIDVALRRSFPNDTVVLKKRRSAGSRGLHVAGPGDPLPQMVRESPTEYLEQICARGVELSFDGVVLSDGRVVGPIVRRRLATREGLAVVSESIDLGEMGTDLYRRVAAVVQSRGALNVQAFFDGTDVVGVTDVNPKFPAGGMALTAALGLNMPALVISDLLYGPDHVDVTLPPFRFLRQYRRWADVIVAGRTEA